MFVIFSNKVDLNSSNKSSDLDKKSVLRIKINVASWICLSLFCLFL
jgi:hypothetical protein